MKKVACLFFATTAIFLVIFGFGYTQESYATEVSFTEGLISFLMSI